LNCQTRKNLIGHKQLQQQNIAANNNELSSKTILIQDPSEIRIQVYHI
jgi:hypothetical protein